MKKLTNSTLLMLVGAVLVLLGLVLMILNKPKQTYEQIKSEVLSNEEAKEVVKDTLNRLIDVYESPDKVFKVVEKVTEEPADEETTEEPKEEPVQEEMEDEEYLIISDYDSIVKTLFTEKGIKEIETVKFNDKQFIVKEEDTVKVLKELPIDNRFKGNNITIGSTKVTKDSIQSEITMTTYLLKEETLTYYVVVKNLTLIKKNDEWLIDSFKYNNQ